MAGRDTPAQELPPEVADAEIRLIAEMLNGYATEVCEAVRPEWVQLGRHRRLLDRAITLLAEGRVVDLVTACEGLDRDTMLYAATTIDRSLGGVNILPLAQCLERDWRRRETQAIGRQLSNGSALEPERVRYLTGQLVELSDASSASDRIAARAMSGDALMASDIAPLKSILGLGVIPEGGMALVVGHSGLGKTFLALQLMRALAEGTEWLETFWTDPEGLRVGLLELEMPASSIKDRLKPIAGDWLRNTSFLCTPEFPISITEHATQDELIRWIQKERLNVITMDPANRLHGLDENKATDMALFMAGCHRVREKTGVAMVILHHVTKTIQDVKTAEATPRTMVLQMVRGSGRLGNDPDTIIGLLEAPGHRVKLVFAKTRHCETPHEVYLKRGESGYFERSEAIQTARANESTDRIRDYLTGRTYPASLDEIAAAVKMSDQGVRKRLVAMEAEIEVTQGRPKRYAIRTAQLTTGFVIPTDWDS